MSATNWIGLLGMAAIVACWVLAVPLYRVGQPGSAARRLSWLLIVESLCLLTAGFPEFAFGVDKSFVESRPLLGMVLGVSHHAADAAVLAMYPGFLALALRTRFTKPLRRKSLRIGLPILAAALFVAGPVSVAVYESFVGLTLVYVGLVLVFLYALAVSIHAWRTSPPGPALNRARAFTVAFGVRDLCWGFVYGSSIYMTWTGTYTSMSTEFEWAVKVIYALGTLLAVPLIAYGVLRAKLFDIDLKVQWTIKQSTLAAFMLAFFFLISEGASEFLSEELGSVAGLVLAAVLIFFLAPLHRFAERVASSAMPNTRDTPEYRSYRKMQVYEAALLEALEEGGISRKERALLKRLADSLEISPADAHALEDDVVARLEGSDAGMGGHAVPG